MHARTRPEEYVELLGHRLTPQYLPKPQLQWRLPRLLQRSLVLLRHHLWTRLPAAA